VFGFHLQEWHVWSPARAFASGYGGVAFFFVLSGFVLTWTWRPGDTPRRFYRRRFARVYPNHLAGLLAALVVPVVAVDRGGRLATPLNALLLQAWPRDPRIVYSLNGVDWSLSCEAAFYAAFPFALLALLRLGRRARWLVAGAYFAAFTAYLAADTYGHAHGLGGFSANPLVRGGEFLLGVAVALDVRDGRRLRVPVWVTLVLLALAGLATRNVSDPAAEVPIAALAAVALAATASADLSRRPGPLGHRALVYAGQASFAFYVVHELVIVNLRHAGLHGPAGAAAMLLAAAVAAVALHELVERPAQRRLSRGR
jgi:peptidoglycan/LPS O-acetylase OafA/YrhL